MTYYKTYDDYTAASRQKAARRAAIRAASLGSVWQFGDHLIAKTPHHDPQVSRTLRALGFEWSRKDQVWIWTAWTVEPGEGYVGHKMTTRPNPSAGSGQALEAARQEALQKAQAVLAKHYAVEEVTAA